MAWARVELGAPRPEFESWSIVDCRELRAAWFVRREREDLRIGQICATIANSSGFRAKDAPPAEAADFFAWLKAPTVAVPFEDFQAFVEHHNATLKATGPTPA